MWVRRVMKARMSVRSAVRWARRSRIPRSTSWARALGQLEQAVGLDLRLLDQRLRLLAGVLPDLLGDALGREQGVLEDRLALAVLVEQAAQVWTSWSQPVALALERRHLLGDDVQVGAHLVRGRARASAAEGLALDVHGRDLHGWPPMI